jgi:putative tryptophan/tyrosine transport system substrate-binding protein
VIGGGALFTARSKQLAGLALRHAAPTVFETRALVAAGGLMSYGTNLADTYHQVGVYTGRVLKGAKPADMPVVQRFRPGGASYGL